MKYLNKYFAFYEGGLKMSETIKRYLEHSPAMLDIIALIDEQEITEPIFNVKKEGDLVYDVNKYNRFFGQTINAKRNTDGSYTYKINSNSKLKFEETVDDLETCLRHIWAYIVSMLKKVKVTTTSNQEITRKLLLNTETKLCWGEKNSLEEIFSKLNSERKIDMVYVRHVLNESFSLLGIVFGSNNEDFTNIIIPTNFGRLKGNGDNFLSLILRGLFDINDNRSGTSEGGYYREEKKHIIIDLKGNYKKDYNKKKTINPRNNDEAVIQCLSKVYRYYGTQCQHEHLIHYGGETLRNDSVKDFIKQFSTYLANEIAKNGIESLNEEVIYKVIYAAVVSINDSYRLINIIEKSAPKFWDKLKKYDVTGMETASKMGDMGF